MEDLNPQIEPAPEPSLDTKLNELEQQTLRLAVMLDNDKILIHKERRFYRTAVAIILVIALLAIGAGWKLKSKDYNPLGNYPIQIVANKLPGHPEPAMNIGDTVNVTATKCVKSKSPVRILSSSSWILVKPTKNGDGMTIPKSRGNSRLATSGCTTTAFNNAMNQELLDKVNQLAKEGVHESTWYLAGVDVPISSQGKNGNLRIWQTQNFTIID